MDRADRAGLGVAVVGHLALLAALSIGLAWRVPPVKPIADAMDVQLVDAVGLKSAAPEPATEAPQQAEAPEAGPPAEAAPPPAPAPTPAPSKPAPTPPPEPKSEVPPPKPVPPKPEPAKQKAPEKPAKPAPSKSLSDILKDVRSSAKSEQASAAKADRAAGAKLGPDFLKGVLSASAGKGEKARATVTGPALNGLAAAIKRQIQPCYDLGGLGGTPAMQIVTVLQLRFNADGSVAGTPQLVEQQGVNDGNRAYAKQMIDVSRRAILRCAPLKLPAELYSGGWENITMGFIPGQMQ